MSDEEMDFSARLAFFKNKEKGSTGQKPERSWAKPSPSHDAPSTAIEKGVGTAELNKAMSDLKLSEREKQEALENLRAETAARERAQREAAEAAEAASKAQAESEAAKALLAEQEAKKKKREAATSDIIAMAKFLVECGLSEGSSKLYAEGLVVNVDVASSKKLEVLYDKGKLTGVLEDAGITSEDDQDLIIAKLDALKAPPPLPNPNPVSPPSAPAVATSASSGSAASAMKPIKDLDSLQTMVDAIKDGTIEKRMQAFKAIFNYSCAEGNAIKLAEPNLGLLETLVNILSSNETEVEFKNLALKLAINLSCTDAIRPRMGSEELGLLRALVSTIKHPCTDESRSASLRVLMNLSASCGSYMGSDDLGLISVLSDVIKDDKTESGVLACKVCINLSCVTENRSALGTIAPVLINIISSGTDQRIPYLKVLLNLSSDTRLGTSFGSPELGLLPVIANVIVQDKGESRSLAARLLTNISSIDKNRKTIASQDSGLVPAIGAILMEDVSDSRLSLLKVILNVSIDTSTGTSLAHGNVIGSLVHVIRTDENECRRLALKCLVNISSTQENRLSMASFSTGDGDLKLLSALSSVISQSNADAKLSSLKVLLNLSSEITNGKTLASKDSGVLNALTSCLLQVAPGEDEIRRAALMVCYNLSATQDNLAYMASAEVGLHNVLLNIVQDTSIADGQAGVLACKVVANFATISS